MAQLSAGHRPGSAYYKKRIEAEEAATCPDCGETEAKDHWLDCGALEAARVECGVTGLEDLRTEATMKMFLRRVGWLC